MNEMLMINIPVTLGVYLAVAAGKGAVAKKKIAKVLQEALTDGLVFIVVLAVVQMILVKLNVFPAEAARTWSLWPF